MKKIVAIVIAVLMVAIVFTACSATPAASSAAPAASVAPASSAAPVVSASSVAPASSAEVSAAVASASGGSILPPPPPKGKALKVGFSILVTDGYYVVAMIDEYNKQIVNLGYSSVMLNCNFDTATQVAQMDNLIAQKVDVIVLMPNDALALIPECKKADAAGIPVFLVHAALDDATGMPTVVGFGGCDNVKLGNGAGTLMNAALGSKGNVVIEAGSIGSQSTNDETKGFSNVLAPAIKTLATVDDGWDRTKSETNMENLLTKYGDQINGVWCLDDNTAIGAINAIQAAGRKDIKVVGINGQREAWDYIKNGELYGTVIQDPIANIDIVFKLLSDYQAGNPIQKYNYSNSPTVDKTNVDKVPPAF